LLWKSNGPPLLRRHSGSQPDGRSEPSCCSPSPSTFSRASQTARSYPDARSVGRGLWPRRSARSATAAAHDPPSAWRRMRATDSVLCDDQRRHVHRPPQRSAARAAAAPSLCRSMVADCSRLSTFRLTPLYVYGHSTGAARPVLRRHRQIFHIWLLRPMRDARVFTSQPQGASRAYPPARHRPCPHKSVPDTASNHR
jgi:hypothetical protein